VQVQVIHEMGYDAAMRRAAEYIGRMREHLDVSAAISGITATLDDFESTIKEPITKGRMPSGPLDL